MADEATLTLTLDTELLDRFLAETGMAMQPAEDVLRDLVRDFVDRCGAAREAEIDEALREADDPEVKRIPHEEAVARLTRQRHGLISRRQASVG